LISDFGFQTFTFRNADCRLDKKNREHLWIQELRGFRDWGIEAITNCELKNEKEKET
jgi:hypothetical protein